MKSVYCKKCNSNQDGDLIWIKFYRKVKLTISKFVCQNCKTVILERDNS